MEEGAQGYDGRRRRLTRWVRNGFTVGVFVAISVLGTFVKVGSCVSFAGNAIRRERGDDR